ncbi:MAG: hypothetical protein ACI91R_001380, partial [Vicingaceae bacterium]
SNTIAATNPLIPAPTMFILKSFFDIKLCFNS